MEGVDSVSEIIPAIIKAITEGKLKAIILSDNPGKTEGDLLDLIENAETNIHKFLQELTPKLQDYVDATIDAATQNLDPEEIRRTSDTPEESDSTKGKDDTPQEEGAKKRILQMKSQKKKRKMMKIGIMASMVLCQLQLIRSKN